jgi:pantetheine-phosphate adenylyltransferase
MSKALFAGTFDPFTLGHKSIVDRTLSVADEIIIAIGVNPNKQTMFTLDERIIYINKVFADNPRITVTHYEGLTTDFAQSIGADFLVRGVRYVKDFEYERQIADVNRQISGIETILLFTEEQYANISSSIIRELISYGKDVTQFLPLPISIH